MLGDITAADEIYLVCGYTDYPFEKFFVKADVYRTFDNSSHGITALFSRSPVFAVFSRLSTTHFGHFTPRLTAVLPKGGAPLEMAKVYGLDLFEYLNFLFEQRPNKGMPDEKLEKLAPWNESVKILCSIK